MKNLQYLIQYWQVLILEITCLIHSAREKKKNILIFHIFLYLDSYSKCRKNDLHLKKVADEDRISQMIDLSPKNRGGWRGGGFSFAEVRTRLTQVEVPVVWLGNS